MLVSGAEASKVVEGIDEDKITAEIEDLQHKLGDLQSNIDKVLQEVCSAFIGFRALKYASH